MSNTKYRLNLGDLRTLTTRRVPTLVGGKTKVVNLPEGEVPKPYRFLDATPGAPVGFGVYVGSRGSSFEVGRRVRGKFVRVSLGSINDYDTLDRAHDEARKKLAYILEKGESPKRQEAIQAHIDSARKVTVEEAMQRYIKRLEGRAEKKKIKPVSVQAVRDSLARLSRQEVALASMQIRDLTRPVLIKGWANVRQSAMRLSNRLPSDMKAKLADRDEWWTLELADFAALGIKGKYIQRVLSSGAVATERTFGDLSRAIEVVMQDERQQCQLDSRQPELLFNPITILHNEDFFRTNKDLAEHYRKAQVRNPLGEDDQSLPKVLKTLMGRRSEQGGHNRVGVDYLLLTLLFGSRRNEAAQLQWYDRCTPDELTMESVSWVWLADEPSQVNPTTKKAGSQAFFHDMKGKEVRFLPIAYFAEKILRKRLMERDEEIAQLPKRIEAAERSHAKLMKETKDGRARGLSLNRVLAVKTRVENMKFVFPARNAKSKTGHYTDSKSILKNVRRDAGMVDLRKDIDIGLTPHDLRRTLGRYAGRRFQSAKLVSQMLHHKIQSEGAAVSDIYTDQEWSALREAFALVEEDMIGTSPRVWNMLRGTDKPRLDEAGDEPVTITKGEDCD